MTKEEEFDWLCRLRSEIYVFMPKEWLIPMNNALDMAIKDLKQEPKWIPVSERLPEDVEFMKNNGFFIVSDGNRTYAEYFDVYCSRRFGEPTMSGFRVDYAVTAWMPLPKPYEPQESEERTDGR